VIEVRFVDFLRREHCLAHGFSESDTRGLALDNFNLRYLVIRRGRRWLSHFHLRFIRFSLLLSEGVVVKLFHLIDVWWCQRHVDVCLIDVPWGYLALEIFCGFRVEYFRVIFKAISWDA
jgi:hypothetical protein